MNSPALFFVLSMRFLPARLTVLAALCATAATGLAQTPPYQLTGGAFNSIYQGTSTIAGMTLANRPAALGALAGGAGPRSPFIGTFTGSAWSDAQAELAVTNGGKVKQIFDRVTLTSTTPAFSETRSWTGTAWVKTATATGAASGNVWADANANALFAPTTAVTKSPNVLVTLQRTGTNAAEETRYWSGTAWVAFALADQFSVGRSTATGVVAVIVTRVKIGAAFAGGAPQYYLGDTIFPPSTDLNGNALAAGSTYWRLFPVKYNEPFSQTDTSPATTDVPQTIDNTTSYYYSEHAQKVFATQAGPVTLVWVTSEKVRTTNPVDDRLRYRFRTDTFTVSPSTTKPVRTIYWTELAKGSDGPTITLPQTVELAVPAYTSTFPQKVDLEIRTGSSTGELRTLWFDNSGGIGTLHAFNREGRIFVEYLGATKAAGGKTRNFLGADIVEVVEAAVPVAATTNLGEKILPRDVQARALPLDGASEWLGSPVPNTKPGAQSYYGQSRRPDGWIEYYAERVTESVADVMFYWLGKEAPGIPPDATSGGTNVTVYWPKIQNAYLLRWNPDVASYVINTVASAGSPANTGIKFTASGLPSLVFQDDPAQMASSVDLNTQRFVVTFAGGSINRSLLKFQNATSIWYQTIYSVPEPSTLTETDTIVGQRINPPAGHSAGGYIASGTAYDPDSYIDPFAAGLTAAERGAIIPVNAVPVDDQNALKIWWFKPVTAPLGTGFSTFYAPSTVGKYRLRFPRDTDASPPSTIVLASNQGSGDLSASEAAGRLYVQNDRTKIGFNPNEEHAILKNGRVWALRDDLNDTNAADSTPYTSEPFVLLCYTSATDGRPAMRAFKLVRELVNATDPSKSVLFNFPIVAGTILQGPMPLPLLPQPIDATGKTLNREVRTSPVAVDLTPAAGLSDLKDRYDSFTFKDRKGFDWVYRGPHTGAGIQSVSLVAGGSGYSSVPTAVFSGGGGSGAAATVTMSAVSLASIALTAGGSGYTSAPTVALSGGGGSGAAATTTLASTFVTSLTLGAGGSGYTSAPTVSFTGSDGTGTTATATLAPTTVASIAVVAAGSGYTAAPTVTFSGGGGTGAAATATLTTATLASIAVTAGGSNYTAAPTVNFTGGGGSGAAATATFNATTKVVTAVNITNAGSGYTSAPAITFTGGGTGAVGAAATATLSTRSVASVAVTSPGSGYTSAPTISFSGTGGATATATLSARAVASVTLVNTGSGYTSTPIVTLSGGGGTGATATATLATRSIGSISVTNAGSGYTLPPVVTFTGGGGTGATGAAALATQSIAAIALTNPGSGYSSTPLVTFNGGGGSGASALASLGTSANLGMQFWYPAQDGFYVPGVDSQPTAGTPLPYLRSLTDPGDPLTGTPLTILYTPKWPDTAPELHVGETLTLPKYGLPEVLRQSSAEVFYQQSVAVGGSAQSSVVLHDPVHEKVYALGGGGLAELPKSIPLTSYQGKTYFQGLPPHLQQRFYHDPLRGAAGSLVLLGKFVDEPVGEDYLLLNVLSKQDRTAISNLAAAETTSIRANWDNAIDQLVARVETFVESPTQRGTYAAGPNPASVDSATLIEVKSPDTAVVDYALTATGKGAGWVTMLFGNGKAFTPASDPVAVQIFRVAPRLYSGELKLLASSNPLDEQITLRHTGDFAGVPENYVFEWRYAQGSASTPPVYELETTAREPLAYGGKWRAVQLTQTATNKVYRPTDDQYAAGSLIDLPPGRSFLINANADNLAGTYPGVVLKSEGGVDLDPVIYATGVPAKIILSAKIASPAGFVLFVNDAVALAYNAPASFTNSDYQTGLVTGLLDVDRQFPLDPGFFKPGLNKIEIALFWTGNPTSATTVNFRLHAFREVDRVAPGGGQSTPWTAANVPTTTDEALALRNQVVVGGSPSAPLGSPVLVMSDNYFTMRYRPKTAAELTAEGRTAAAFASVAGSDWSRWATPVLVEGWVKRVLGKINPFNQRMADLYNNAINTDVSLLTQAGMRWEGNVALTLDNLNNVGLIEFYETLLNRAKAMSIDSGIDDPGVNDALLLAAGYLNDLYTILGNEAYADAANPTISVDDATTTTEVNTSRFSFEGQVKSVLEEELALLRGRDDFLQPGISTTPAYNRLYWNYTKGINSGEAIYAMNYNIREKAGSPTADGIVDAADAQRMFPQGHGDAYGHYLTALTGYYHLLHNRSFTWTPRSEAVNVLGKAVQVDYFDERKFAAAAANVAATAQQVVALTYRQSYKDDPAAGWTSFRDGKINPNGGTRRDWGLDEWTSRATQGAYYHWMMGNALLPPLDTDPNHTGVQVIDRTSVPELSELVDTGASFQTTIDSANAHLNPLGLSPGAIAFDISSAELKAGRSHYEQVYDRALQAVKNAKGAFDQAAKMTRLLRSLDNQVDNQNTAIADQERAFNRQLIEIYGTPYSGSIGAGQPYAQGYTGPDYQEWFVVDRPTDLVDVSTTVSISFAGSDGPIPVSLDPSRLVQFSQQWRNGSSMGARSVTGTLQQALLDEYEAQVAYRAALDRLTGEADDYLGKQALLREMIATQVSKVAARSTVTAANEIMRNVQVGLELYIEHLKDTKFATFMVADALAKALPTVNGIDNDSTSAARGALYQQAAIANALGSEAATQLGYGVKVLDLAIAASSAALEGVLDELDFSFSQKQFIFENGLAGGKLVQSGTDVAIMAVNLARATVKISNRMAEGERVRSELAIFRQRSAAIVQGYRTRDLTFRTFRNEALEQYRSLFDLASRYTYLSAKSYDYETGLLGSSSGQDVLNAIVASRSLGDLTGGVPQASVSTLGDAGLAGSMARIQADWSVAKGRLGINNPDQNGTLFSLRRELFRLVDDPARTDDDAQWRQTLEQYIMSNVLTDADVAAQCRNLRKPDGSAVPGIVIPFRTAIQHGQNFFGLPITDLDHAFSASNFATKIYSVGLVLRGYVGMDPYLPGSTASTVVAGSTPNALSATPYVYLIPTGTDYLRAPPLGDTDQIRGWTVADQAMPLPFNLGATAFSTSQFFNANGTLSEVPWVLRKHQAFRPVSDPSFFYGSVPSEFTSSRLVGRSAWNGGWKLVIPAYMLYSSEQEGLNRLVASVTDIQLFLRTYSHSGN